LIKRNDPKQQTKQDAITKLQEKIKQLESEKKDIESFYGKVLISIN